MDIRATKKIVIDAGHGGDDPGTSANGIVEKDLTLKISEYLHKRFDELGIPNEMTRTSDVTLGPSDRPTKAQSFYGNGSDVILLSNHINAGGGDGAEIIYALRNSDELSSTIANEFIKSGQNVRKYYQRRLPSDPSKDYYYILRDTPNNESVIIEYGFADSTGDDVSLLKNNWEELAEAVVRAVASYVGVPYSSGSSGTNSYVVKSGDTLWSIAKKFGVSVDDLKEKNNLTSNALSINQVLLIPTTEEEPVTTGEYYTVVAGDNLYAIARRFGLTVDELKSLNHLTSNNLSIGQKLLVKASGETSNGNVYVVKSGDTLYKIANQYGLTVNELKDLNGLTSDSLSIGQTLVVGNSSSSGSNDTMYTVVPGDSLYAIANRYGVTVDELKAYNNLTSNMLSIGQILKIPSHGNEVIYTVVAGDNLYAIAQKYNTSVNAIMNANNLTNSMLSIGQKLIIP